MMNQPLRLFFPIVLIAFASITCGCQDSAQTERIAALESQLERARTELKVEQTTASRQLVHIVWFQLKKDADSSAVIEEIRKLASIPGVCNLRIGKFQDLGDQRAMSELDLVMQMNFDVEDDYRSYQAHSIHQQLKKDIGPYMEMPPVTYDYWTE